MTAQNQHGNSDIMNNHADPGGPTAASGRTTVVGLFRDRTKVESAISDLKAAGFANDDIGVAMRDRTEQGNLIEETGTKAADGATAGLLSGGAIGGVVGALIGAGALLIPGIGPVLAGGALASIFGITGGTAVAGAGIGAATGGLVGGLVGLGLPENEAKHFEKGFKEGGIVVTVTGGARSGEALELLRTNGADLGPGTVRVPTATATSNAPSAA
jgi:hypothetical protein